MNYVITHPDTDKVLHVTKDATEAYHQQQEMISMHSIGYFLVATEDDIDIDDTYIVYPKYDLEYGAYETKLVITHYNPHNNPHKVEERIVDIHVDPICARDTLELLKKEADSVDAYKVYRSSGKVEHGQITLDEEIDLSKVPVLKSYHTPFVGSRYPVYELPTAIELEGERLT